MAREMRHAAQSVTPEARRARREAIKRRKNRKVKVSKPFRVFMLLWILVLIIVGAYALIYVNGMLKEMQASQPSQLISDTLSRLSDNQVKSLFDFNTSIDEGNQVKNVKEFFKNGKYTVKQVMGTDEYNIYNEGRKILSVSLKKVRTVSKLVIFNYSIYELEKLIPTEEKELYHYEITAPSVCSISLGGKELSPTSSEPLANFSDASKYVKLPAENYYLLDHLTKPADLKITKNGAAVQFDLSEKMVIASGYEHYNTLKDAGCDFDVIGFAENWSKYMTDDLGGTRHGFNTIAKSLIKDSEMYQKAWKWATNVDITFVSKHTLKNPAFTEQSATNVVKYSNDAISVDVHLVKHMRIANNTGDHDDVMDSTFYLIKHDGAWNVVNIRGRVAGNQ